MRLAYQIPLFTGLAIIATVFVNIVAFHYFMGKLFLIYTNEIQLIDQKGTLSPEKLSTILDVSTLPADKQDEYKDVVSELGNISIALQNISENPELYLQAGLGPNQTGSSTYDSIFSTAKKLESPFTSISSLFLNPSDWDKDSPEGRLVFGLLARLLITNIIFLVFILIGYFIWIRRIFIPVHLIIDRLNAYIDSSRYQTISYKSNDEFFSLVSTINSLYKSLRVQENIRSNFLSDISHEIRTPITAVKCYLEAIEDGMMQLDSKTIPLLQNELTRLTSITEQIMEYENLTHTYTDSVHIERFAIKKQIDSILYEYLPQLEKNHQKILITSEGDVFVRMDKNMFIQILHNIFSNFIKYAGMNTTLQCEYIRNKDTVSIKFSDNGIGIPEDEINLVKEKFYRVDKSRTRDSMMSMGIGLSIIDHIVRIHDGNLDISNNSPNGLSITLTFPR